MQTKADYTTIKQRYSAARLFRMVLCGLFLVMLPVSVSAQYRDYRRLYGVRASAPMRPFSSSSQSVGAYSFYSTSPAWFGQDVSSPAVNYAAGYTNGWNTSGSRVVFSPLGTRKRVHMVRSMGGVAFSSRDDIMFRGLSSVPFPAPRVVSVRSVVPLSGVTLGSGLAVPIVDDGEDSGGSGDDDGWLPPSNPEEDPVKIIGQITENGPIGDAVVSLLCGAVLFMLYRRRRLMRVSKS